jgi:hypothetical protein
MVGGCKNAVALFVKIIILYHFVICSLGFLAFICTVGTQAVKILEWQCVKCRNLVINTTFKSVLTFRTGLYTATNHALGVNDFAYRRGFGT